MRALLVFAVCLVLAAQAMWGQTPFAATYNLAGGGNNLTSFSYNGTSYDGVVPGDLVKVGITSTSSEGNFRGSNWPLGATDGSNVFTGSVDLGKYIGFTIAAAAGYRFTVTSISFGIGRSAAGPRQWQWRGSADDFGSLLSNYSSLNADLTATDGVLTNPDLNSNWTGNVLEPGAGYLDVIGAVGFRLYGFNAEATGGTGGLQGNITISGTFELAAGPTIVVNTTAFDGSFGNVNVASSSATSSFIVGGSDLTDDITVTPPPGFEIRTGAFPFSTDPIVLSQIGGAVSETTIDVRFTPDVAGLFSGDITCVSAGATTQNVTVSGTGILPIPFQVVFHETLGNVTAITAIAAHTSANGFDNDGLSFSGTADIRSTSASTGYDGASGGANGFFTNTVGRDFIVSGINTTGLMNLELSFGIFKNLLASDGSDFFLEVSGDGATYELLSFPLLPTGSGTATWHYRTAAGSIPAVSNLHIRFRQGGSTTQYRIDDLLLRNGASAPTVTADGPTTFCAGESVTLMSSAAASYLWSTGDMTQSIAVSEAGGYSVTVTDAKGNSATSDAVNVSVAPSVGATGPISGPTLVIEGQTGVEYSIDAVDGATEYIWTVPAGATIVSGQGTTMITVDWGTTDGDVNVTPGNDCSSGPANTLTVSFVGGMISGTISIAGGGGQANVIVKLLDDTNAPLDEETTNAAGAYSFSGLAAGGYNIMVVEPLGYLADANPLSAELVDETPVVVDVELAQVVVANNARKHSYWKHQFDVHVKGKGKFDETAAQLQSYINLVHQHYSPHFDIFVTRFTLEDWQDALSKDRDLPPHVDKAMQEIATLVMNFSSLKVGQYTVVTDDGRTAGEVLTYVSQLFSDPDATKRDYKRAKELAKKVNDDKRIHAGQVPASSVLYKRSEQILSWGFDVPTEFALHNNYPNPFNPTTSIRYDLPLAGYVRLKVFNTLGQEVAVLVEDFKPAGRHMVTFNAHGLPSGAYFYQIRAGQFLKTMKLIITK
jgi:hypothetical protein